MFKAEDPCRSAIRYRQLVVNMGHDPDAQTSSNRYGRQLRVLPILEKKEHGRWHFHAAIEPPRHVDPDRFQALIHQCWSKVDLGYREIMARPNADRGWINYMLKRRQKSAFDAWSELGIVLSYKTP